MLVSPLLTLFSTDALHMAHCANEETVVERNKSRSIEALIKDFIILIRINPNSV